MPLRPPIRRAVHAAALTASLCACGSDPYLIGSPTDAKDVAQDHPTNVGKVARQFEWQPIATVQALSFCYSGLLNSYEEAREEAALSCKGGWIEDYDVDYHFRGCALLQPYRATFLCHPGGETEPSLPDGGT